MFRLKYIAYLLVLFYAFACSPSNTIEKEFTEDELMEITVQSIALANELKFEEAFTSFNYLLKVAKQSENGKYEIIANLNLGLLYYRFNEKEQALDYYLKSLDLSVEYNIDDILNAVYNNLGILYSENSQYSKAENYIRRALLLSKKQNKPQKEIINLINLATIKEKINQLDSALFFNNQALSINEQNNTDHYQSAIINSIGEILYKEGKYEEANFKFSQSLSLIQPNPDQSVLGTFQLNLGKTFVQLNKYDSAKVYLNESLTYLKKTNNLEGISDCYYWLSRNEHLNEPSLLAQSYFDECLAWKDSVLFQNKDKWISEVKLKYEFGKIEKEIEFLEERDAIQKKIIYTIVFVSILFILFLISVWKSRTRNLRQKNIILHNEKELAKIEMEKKEVQKVKLEEEMESQKQLSEIKQENIKLELEHKNKEVVSKAIHLMNKNEILNSLYELVLQIDISEEGSNKDIIEEMRSSIKNNLNQDKAWEDFKLHFEQVHESFISQLNLKHSDLSPTDLRLCAYLLIGLNPKEIAYVSNISPESVRKRKQRLRQKLSLNANIEIEEYLKSLK